MRKNVIMARAFAVLLLFSIATAWFPNRLALCAPNEIDQRIGELDQVQKEIDDLKKQLNAKTSAEKSVMAEIAKLDAQLQLANKELEYIALQLSITDQRLTETKSEVADMEQKLKDQQEALDTRLVSMYKSSRVSYVELLLSSGSLSDLMARVHYLKAIAVQDAALIDEFNQSRSALLAKKMELEGYQTKLLGLQASEELKRAEVASRSVDRESYLAGIKGEKDRLAAALDQMEKEAEALVGIISDLQAKGQKPQAHPLQMAWPCSGGWISDYYGNRLHPILGTYRWHDGLDYAANTGTPIKAAEDGTVILSGVNGGYGNCVILDHGGNVSTLYGHASKLLVKVGQDVIKGQTIALVGSTGVSTGAHLHFEVRVNGKTQNPLDWLPK